jgi:GMP synthase-like glutamine amidotransferase
VLSVVHEPSAGSGVFARVGEDRQDELIEWIPARAGPPPVADFDAALVFGGATHADQEPEYGWLRVEKELLGELLEAGTPALGVCLGAQLLAEVAGGSVSRMASPEIGWARVRLARASREDPLLGALPEQFESFQWHSYEISAPEDAVVLAHSAACLQAFRLISAPWWGIQFHAEATGETIAAWIEDYRRDPDAAGAEINWQALRARTRREIARWNELGQGVCTRFLVHVRALAGA